MSFTENNHNGLIYMSSDKIGARHAFTTRYGGVSTGIFSSLNLGSNRGDDPEAVRENYRRVCELMGVYGREKLCMPCRCACDERGALLPYGH